MGVTVCLPYECWQTAPSNRIEAVNYFGEGAAIFYIGLILTKVSRTFDSQRFSDNSHNCHVFFTVAAAVAGAVAKLHTRNQMTYIRSRSTKERNVYVRNVHWLNFFFLVAAQIVPSLFFLISFDSIRWFVVLFFDLRVLLIFAARRNFYGHIYVYFFFNDQTGNTQIAIWAAFTTAKKKKKKMRCKTMGRENRKWGGRGTT